MKFSVRKSVSALMAAVMLLTSGVALSSSTAEADGMVLQQYDAEWGSYPYGDGNLGNSGCGALAIVNAVRYLTGNTIDIYEIADWGSQNEYIWGVGSSFSIAPNAAAQFGSTYGFQLDSHDGFSSYIGDCYPGSEAAFQSAWNTLVTKLSAGEVAVGLVHNHFISIVDYDPSTGKVLVYDPGAGANRQTTTSGDWKSYDELNYWSNAGTSMLKLRGYLTYYFSTGASATPDVTTTQPTFSGSSDVAGTYVVTTEGSALNMRDGASTSASIISQIPAGAQVQVIESDGTWANVTYNGISGYCSVQYLTKYEGTETSSTTTTTATTTISETTITTTTTAEGTTTVTSADDAFSEEYAGDYVISASGFYLNLRADASPNGKVLAVIPDKTSVTVTAANGEWAAVSWDGKEGYCSMQYLKKADDSSETTTEETTTTSETTTTTTSSKTMTETTTEETSSETTTTTEETTSNTTTTAAVTTTTTASTTNADAGAYRVDTDGAHLNLRAKDSIDSLILTQIPNESEVFVISTDGEWANVSWNGIVGFCKAEYLTKVIIDADQSASQMPVINAAYATIYGDVNMDFEVTMNDVVLLHKALTGDISLNVTAAANADCYQDGKLNTVDATVIIQSILENCNMPVQPVM